MMVLSIISISNGQENIDKGPRIDIPTPTGLYKYVTYPVGNFTGIPDIRVPLHQVALSGMELPISISYHGSGHKVNDIASWIGLGFGLHAGGAITRTVVGRPDEDIASGIFEIPVRENVFTGNWERDFHYQSDIVTRKIDSEPDVFYYNFMGMSGKFSFNSQREILQQPYTDIKIEFTNDLFKITDELGNQYFFNDVARTFSYIDFDGGLLESATSWHLTKIITADKKDVVDFIYVKDSEGGILTVDYSLQVGSLAKAISNYSGDVRDAGIENLPVKSKYYSIPQYCFLSQINFSNGSITFKSTQNRMDYGKRTLDSIVVRNSSEVIKKIAFDHSYFFNDEGYNPDIMRFDKYRLKLDGVQIAGSDKAIAPQRFAFEYEEGYKLPPRNNSGVDLWGYSNGKINNRTLVPLPDVGSNYEFEDMLNRKTVTNITSEFGDRKSDENHMKAYQLKRVIYPTKGYTDFEFESNRRNTIVEKEVTTTLAYLIATKEDAGPGVVEFVPSELVTSATLTMNLPLWDDTKQPYIEVWNLTKNRRERFTTYPEDGLPTFRSTTLTLIPGDRYRLIANIKKNPRDPNDDIDQRVIANIIHTGISKVSSNEIGPGLRIQKIKSYTANNVLASTEEYKYGIGESGLGEPRFFDYIFNLRSYVQKFGFAYIADHTINRPASNFKVDALQILSRPIFDYYGEGYTFAYPYVTKYITNVANGTRQKIIYEYEFQKDQQYAPGVPEVVSLVSSFWMVGQLKSETLFSLKDNGTYDTLRRTVNNYYNAESLKHSIGLRVRRNEIKRGTLTLDQEIHEYFTYFTYPVVSGLKKLRSTEETTYTNGLADIRTLRTYDYLGNLNLQPRLVSQSLSKGGLETSYSTYPQDYLVGTPFIDKMIANNILKKPIETVRYQGTGATGLLNTGTVLLYDADGKGLVDKHYAWKSKSAALLPAFKFSNRTAGALPDSPNKALFGLDSRYKLMGSVVVKDKYGNPSEIKRLAEPSTVYLWGYSGQYPIAEIVNSTYTEVLQKIGGQSIVDQLNNIGVTEDFVAQKMTALRTALPHARITSYTYKSWVGMSTKTDPKGVTEYYYYDGAQRLKHVLDQFKYVERSLDYHYRP